MSNMLCARHLFKPKPLSPQLLSVFALSIGRKQSTQKQDVPLVEALDEDEVLAIEAAIEEKRNKSGLHQADYNRQHDKPPYDEPKTAYHETLRFKRRLYGKYGEMSKVNPSILWPSKVELAAIKEYMGVAQPFTIQELLKRLEEKKEMEKEKRKKIEAEILEKVRKVPNEILEFKRKVEEKRLKAEALVKKKEQLIRETRKHFDYPIDVRDEKFQMKLLELQEEEKRRQKSEKKLKKAEKEKVAEKYSKTVSAE